MIRIICIVFMFSASICQAQTKWPVWVIPSNDTINGLSIGLADVSISKGPEEYKYQRNGVRIELIGLGIGTAFYNGMGSDSLRFDEIKSGNQQKLSQVNGLNISLSGSMCHAQINGLSFNGLSHIVKGMNGLSASMFINECFGVYNGVQIAFSNHAVIFNGLQMGGINYGHETKGLQIGLVNRCKMGNAVQVGLVNINKTETGFQFGLWNINSERKLPIINW